MKGSISKTIAIAACVAIALIAGQQAKAISYSLSVGNSAISGYTGPYGTVLVSLTDSTHAKITFTALDSGANHFLFGAQGIVGLNVNGAVTFGGITSYTGYPGINPSAPDVSVGGAGNEDGFGAFNFTLDSFDGFGYALRSLTFTLTDTSGTWANDASVLIANGNHATAAAHIFVANSTYTGDALATGYAAAGAPNGPPPQVPDGGSTVTLLGCAVAGIGAVARKFRKA